MATRRFLFQSSEGYADSASLTDDTQLAKLVLTGLSGVALDASSQRIAAVATPTSGTDAANKDYVDSVASGLDIHASCRLGTAAALPSYTPSGSGVGKTLTATANGALSVDGLAVVVGNRVLVKDEGGGTSAHNGVYVVTQVGDGSNPYILTRATDADQNAEVTAGFFVFVTEGTANADSGWVLVTDDPITVDTTALSFTQFSGVGALIAGAGLIKTGSTVDVELDTTANAQGAGASGGSSGLEFHTTGVAGKLRAAVHATGGLERTATGLAVRIDDTPDTLDADADGLKVVGVPSLFKINGTAVGATVTAANLDTLTNVSDSSALHFHNLNETREFTASGAVTKADGLYISGNDVLSTGDCTVDAKSRVVGVAFASVSGGATVRSVVSGTIPGSLSGATANTRYYLGSTGQPVVIGSVPSSARTIQLGIAKNATDMFVQIIDFGKKP